MIKNYVCVNQECQNYNICEIEKMRKCPIFSIKISSFLKLLDEIMLKKKKENVSNFIFMFKSLYLTTVGKKKILIRLILFFKE